MSRSNVSYRSYQSLYKVIFHMVQVLLTFALHVNVDCFRVTSGMTHIARMTTITVTKGYERTLRTAATTDWSSTNGRHRGRSLRRTEYSECRICFWKESPKLSRGLYLMAHSSSTNMNKERGIEEPVKAVKSEAQITTSSSSSPLYHGLSKFHLSILSRTADRQCFVTGRDPVIVTVVPNSPTRKWLNLGRRQRLKSSSKSFGIGRSSTTLIGSAETEILVNGTSPDKSLASVDRYQWIDDGRNCEERMILRNTYEIVSIEFLAVIHLERPGYVHVLDSTGPGSSAQLYRGQNSESKYKNSFLLQALSKSSSLSENRGDRLWVTGFSLASRRGGVMSVDTDSCAIQSVNTRTARAMQWPNEVVPVPLSLFPRIMQKNHGLGSTNIDLKSAIYQNARQPIYRMLSRATSHDFLDNNTHNENNLLFESIIPYDTSIKFAHETNTLQKNYYQDALLVCDGFLVPTKDRGGLYIVKNPGHPVLEDTIRLTESKQNNPFKTTDTLNAKSKDANDDDDDRWFYHRAVWIDLTGDGRKSILTARCKVSPVGLSSQNKGDGIVTSGIKKLGQLVWLECPKPPQTATTSDSSASTHFDPFAEKYLPWKTRVLATGPDVMFSIADLDPSDDTIEVFSSQFFAKRVMMHSIRVGGSDHDRGKTITRLPKVTFSRVIDEQSGPAFGSILADLDRGSTCSTHTDSSNIHAHQLERKQCVIDCGSTVKTLQVGDYFSHLLVTSHECSLKPEPTTTPTTLLSTQRNNINEATKASDHTNVGIGGGSLFAYRVPRSNMLKNAWKTEPWLRTTIASGFRVNSQLTNMINPGAPGFVYTFYSKQRRQNTSEDNNNESHDFNKKRRPLIAIAGDCSESAYIFRPANELLSSNNDDENQSIPTNVDPSTQYKMMVEIECGATVGSIGIGYETFGCLDYADSKKELFAHAKLYIPCYEKDRILVFGLGTEED